jgi:hypothetical protein
VFGFSESPMVFWLHHSDEHLFFGELLRDKLGNNVRSGSNVEKSDPE